MYVEPLTGALGSDVAALYRKRKFKHFQCTGDDRKVALWEAWSWKERSQARLFAKGTVDSLACSFRAGAATGSEPGILLISGERAAVWGM